MDLVAVAVDIDDLVPEYLEVGNKEQAGLEPPEGRKSALPGQVSGQSLSEQREQGTYICFRTGQEQVDMVAHQCESQDPAGGERCQADAEQRDPEPESSFVGENDLHPLPGRVEVPVRPVADEGILTRGFAGHGLELGR